MPKQDSRRVFGQTSEAAAENYLRRKGYHILGRNIRSPNGEIDLVAETNGVLVFIEVKARRSSVFGGASLAVTSLKQARLVRLAAQYLAHHRLGDRPCRFDVVLCHGGGAQQSSIEHIENAFEVPGEDLRW